MIEAATDFRVTVHGREHVHRLALPWRKSLIELSRILLSYPPDRLADLIGGLIDAGQLEPNALESSTLLYDLADVLYSRRPGTSA